MRSLASIPARRSGIVVRLVGGLAILVIAIACIAALTLLTPSTSLARGWLVAFAVCSSVPLGSMVLLLIYQLTGGVWGEANAPVLRACAALTPVAAIAFIPVLIAMPDIYPWTAHRSAIPADVGRWYLSEPFFVLRAIIALGGWSLLGIVFAMGAGGRLLAGLGLTFFGFMITLVAVDWYLSVEPHYVDTSFGAMIAVQQLLAALALVAVVRVPATEGNAAADIGALLIAALLGVVYLELMTFVVAWYGDLPDKSAWFLKRATTVWAGVSGAAVLGGAIVPFAMLLNKAVRSSPVALQVAGACILFGTSLHFAWRLVPAFDDPAAVAAAACVWLLILGLALLLIGSALRRHFASTAETGHGA